MDSNDEYNEEFRQIAIDYAQSQSDADRLDGARKRKFSVLVNHYTAQGKSTAAAQHLARADDEYGAAMEAHHAANLAANLAKAVYEAKKISFEFWRTRQSTERAKMNLR